MMTLLRAHRRAATAAAAVLLAVAATIVAFAVASAHGTGASPPAAGAVDALRPSLPAAFAQSPPTALPILSARQASGQTSMPWVLTALDGSRQSLQILYVAGNSGCTSPLGAYVLETATAVTIAAISHTDASQRSCAADLRTGRGAITLASPLGARQLVHAVVDPGWRPYAQVLAG
jgi:hypothetical protein